MLAEVDEPQNYTKTIQSENWHHWQTATESELALLKENSTWTLESSYPSWL